MVERINLEEIYDKNINILIGSGASSGLFPTLSLNMKNDDSWHTVETIATLIEQSKSSDKVKLKALLFMHYYKTCIKPISEFDVDILDSAQSSVIENYSILLKTILYILGKRRSSDRRCNLFTTNYDGCLALTADKILKEGKTEFIINDGTRGFRKKYLQAKNFNSYVRQTGIFSLQHNDLQQINLIHLHGSVYWHKDGENIVVDYSKSINSLLVFDEVYLEAFSTMLEDEKTTFEMLEIYASLLDEDFEIIASKFLNEYKPLPIVNPTKWKFHETVFEEHYYQMLRAMSYELEKPNTVFITFGFSFADEHILNLVKRSLSNPSLQLFICCFDSANEEKLRAKFIGHENVQFIAAKSGNLNFEKFNTEIFTLNPPTHPVNDE